MREQAQARRAELAAQLEQATQERSQLEQLLIQLDRSMCAMQGGIQELDQMLASDPDSALLGQLLA